MRADVLADPVSPDVAAGSEPSEPPANHMTRASWLTRWLASVARGLGGFAALALVYEGLSRLELVNPKLLPPSSVVLPRALEMAFDPEFQVEVWATLQAVLVGVAIACVIAIPAGLLIGSYTKVATATTPIVDFVRSVPGIAIIPLLVLIMGQGLSMKIAVVVYVTLWPLLFNTIYGVRGVDRVAIETARSFRMGPMRTWLRVVMPSSLPLILTGVRLALATGLTVAVAAEISVGTRDGIGYYILLQSYAGLHHDAVFAAVVLAGLVGFSLNWLTTVLTKKYVAWDSRGVQ
jgi:NitT/TauT family transport system permease protein